MGTHGAATAEGQKRVLEGYGISEQEMGVPIRSSLEVQEIGETADDIRVIIDKHAFEANHIVLINRIKWHSDFEYEIESGLMKLMAIGLGKLKGANTYHQAMFRYGYPRVILDVARHVLGTGRILFGVGVVENGYGQTAEISVLRPEAIEEREKELQKKAKRMQARLPFEDIDVLIIDEIGKDIAGPGMDAKVVGRIYIPFLSKEPESPRIKRIVACALTDRTAGNASGVGMADYVTRRLVDKMDMETSYINAITGLNPERARIPPIFENDRNAIAVALATVGTIPREGAPRVMRIKNTRDLGEVEVSEAYREEIEKRDDLKIVREARPMGFDKNGNLEPF